MRPSRIKDKFSRTFSKFSQNCPSRVATRAICENFENTSGNLSLILLGLMRLRIRIIKTLYLFITQRAKFLKTFHCTSKHNPPPALRINNSPHKQFIKLLLSVQKKKRSFMHMFIFWDNYNSSSLTNSHSKLKLSKPKFI